MREAEFSAAIAELDQAVAHPRFGIYRNINVKSLHRIHLASKIKILCLVELTNYCKWR